MLKPEIREPQTPKPHSARIQLLGQLPRECCVAFSGGSDSRAVLDFLCATRKPLVAHFNHQSPHGKVAQGFVEGVCAKLSLSLTIGTISKEKDKKESWEEYWRNQRLGFFHSLGMPVITGHCLNDAIETWVFSSLHGEGRVIPYQNGNVIRPFLLTSKQALREWCEKRGLDWIEDESNNDEGFMRNLIRKKIVPEALKVNPGLEKMMRKKLRGLGCGEV